VAGYEREARAVRGGGGQRDRSSDDEVVEHRRDRRRDEPAACVQHGGEERDEPIRRDLRGEEAQQARARLDLQRDLRAVAADRVQPNDRWCE
jgi:hypothetical protein